MIGPSIGTTPPVPTPVSNCPRVERVTIRYAPSGPLVAKAKTVSDQAQRTELYRKAQVIFKEQAPWFTIAHAVQLAPVRKEVIDFKLSPFGRHTFYGVDIKS